MIIRLLIAHVSIGDRVHAAGDLVEVDEHRARSLLERGHAARHQEQPAGDGTEGPGSDGETTEEKPEAGEKQEGLDSETDPSQTEVEGEVEEETQAGQEQPVPTVAGPPKSSRRNRR